MTDSFIVLCIQSAHWGFWTLATVLCINGLYWWSFSVDLPLWNALNPWRQRVELARPETKACKWTDLDSFDWSL